MLHITGLDLNFDGSRRLYVLDNRGRSVKIEGGRELERIFDKFFRLRCSVVELLVLVELMEQGVAVDRILAHFAA